MPYKTQEQKNKYARDIWYPRNKAKHAKSVKRQKQAYMKKYRDFKQGKPCTDCGGTFPPEAMDFDHVRGVKLFTIAQAVTRQISWKKFLAEAEKCDLVCATCHRIRTRSRRLHEGSKKQAERILKVIFGDSGAVPDESTI